jgi:deoxycytidylate deaminase
MMSERSTCARLNVGCVITSVDFRYVYSVGYNGNASGLHNGCESTEPGNCGCFIEGTEVYPSGVTMAYRRRYAGDIIRVVTTAGEFSVTPNHPILTAGFGWRAAELLQKGDYLLGAVRDENVAARAPNYNEAARAPNYNEAVRIEEVFESLSVSGCVVRHTGASHQFHGDGLVDEDVDVVARDSSLRSYLELGVDEYGNKPLLPASAVVPPLLRSDSEGCRTVRTLSTPMKNPSVFQPAFDDNTANSEGLSQSVGGLPSQVASHDLLDRKVDHALTLVPAEVLGNLAKDPSFSQSVLNCRVGDTKVLCDVADSLTVPVTAYEILHVERNRWSGHVYNLSTVQNWYNLQVGGIIAHNCLHAEENAVINCTTPRYASKVVFTTNLPCPLCAKRLINLGGVQTVYYHRDYRVRDGLQHLTTAGITHVQLEVEL